MTTWHPFLQVEPADASGSGDGGLWEFLNASVENTWWTVLLDGLMSAIIGAAVALVVLLLTVRAQTKGIGRQIKVQEEGLRKQLEAQENGLRIQLEAQEQSIAEQLRVQRHENTRAREIAIVGRMLGTLNTMEDERGRLDITPHQKNADLQTRLTDLLVGFEELRINGGPSSDVVVDSLKLLTRQLGDATRDYLFDEHGRFQNAGLVAYCLGQFFSTHLVRYARMDEAERAELGNYLDKASSEFMPQRAADWENKYVMKLFNGTRE